MLTSKLTLLGWHSPAAASSYTHEHNNVYGCFEARPNSDRGLLHHAANI